MQAKKLERSPAAEPAGPVPGQLSNWPVQIKLVPVQAPYFADADLLVAADCTAFAYGNEGSVARAIADSGLSRDDVFITTKLPADIKTFDCAKEHFYASLKNLGTTGSSKKAASSPPSGATSKKILSAPISAKKTSASSAA